MTLKNLILTMMNWGRFTFGPGGRRVSRMPKNKVREYKNKDNIVIDQDTPNSKDVGYLGSVVADSAGKSVRAKKWTSKVKNIFEIEIVTPTNTIVVEVEYASRDLKDDPLVVTGKIKDSEGDKIGEFNVTIDPKNKEAHIDLIKLDPSFQGAGIGTTIMSHWEDQLARAGITKISLDAVSSTGSFNKYNGAYTWALLGYKPNTVGAKVAYGRFTEQLTAGGRQNKKMWDLRTKLIKDLGITSDSDLAELVGESQIIPAMMKKYRNNFLKVMADYPLFKDYLKGNIPSPRLRLN
jgi:GNAT superfamily N-acetyltransferase